MLKQSVNQNQFLNRSFQEPAEIIVLSETTDTVMSIQEAHDLVRSQDDINTPYLRDLISGITRLVENARGEAITSKVYRAIYYSVFDGIMLANAPIVSIDSLVTLEQGVSTAISSDDYFLQGIATKAVVFKNPLTDAIVQVDYTAGYSTVPADLKALIKSELQFMFKEKTSSMEFMNYLSKMKKKAQGTAPQLYSI